MKFEPKKPARAFRVGRRGQITLNDCGRVQLDPDEQVTFTTARGGELDVTRKSWGFYAAPSLNGRLKQFGLRAALVEGHGKYFLLLVEKGKEDEFRNYLEEEELEIIAWLDREAALIKLKKILKGSG